MTSRLERELRAQIRLLKKRLLANEKLMHDVFIKVEAVEADRQSLRRALEASLAARYKRSKRKWRA